MYDNHLGSKNNETTINNKLLWRIRRLGVMQLATINDDKN